MPFVYRFYFLFRQAHLGSVRIGERREPNRGHLRGVSATFYHF